MNMKNIADDLVKIFDDKGITIEEGYSDLITFTKFDSNSDYEYEFSVRFGLNVQEFEDNLFKHYTNFDVSYETYMLLDDEGHGKYSYIPYELEDVLTYVKNTEAFIMQCYNLISNYNKNRG